MLDFGWSELLLIVALAVLVIGPKEMPQVMRTCGRIVRRIQSARHTIAGQFDELMRDAELEEMRREAELRVMGADDEQGDREREDDEEYLDALPQEALWPAEGPPKTKKPAAAAKPAPVGARKSTAGKSSSEKTTSKKSPAKKSPAKKTGGGAP